MLDSRKYFSDPAVAAFVTDVQRGDVAKVQRALQGGMDPNAMGLEGLRPIHFVFTAADARAADALLSAGADPDAPAPNGHRPLHYAVQQRTAAFVEVLLKHRANPNLPGEGDIPVLYVAMASPVEEQVIPLLTKAGADVNKVWGGYPPLQSAMVKQSWISAALLLRAGADPRLKTLRGEDAANIFCELLARMRPVEPSRRWVYETGRTIGERAGGLVCGIALERFR